MTAMRSWLLLALACLRAPATAPAPPTRFPHTPQSPLFVPSPLSPTPTLAPPRSLRKHPRV